MTIPEEAEEDHSDSDAGGGGGRRRGGGGASSRAGASGSSVAAASSSSSSSSTADDIPLSRTSDASVSASASSIDDRPREMVPLAPSSSSSRPLVAADGDGEPRPPPPPSPSPSNPGTPTLLPSAKIAAFDVEGSEETGYAYTETAAGGGSDHDRDVSVGGLYAYLPVNVRRWMFLSNVPRSVQLFRGENLAVPACYLVVGLLQGLSGPLINVYPLDLGATEAQQATLSSLRSLPATFKLLFGFISDNFPLLGYRRKSYMFLGWLVTSASMAGLMYASNLDLVEREVEAVAEGGGGEGGESGGDDDDDATTSTEWVPADDAPSVKLLSVCLLLFGTGFWFADVMGDSIVAEKAKLEPESTRGHLQSTCYACRFFGLMVAAPLSTVLYSACGPKIVIQIMALLPAVMLPLIYHLREIRNAEVRSTADHCREIWATVCSRAVWQPMGFVYLYNLMQVGNAAWREFLKSVLGFTSNQLNALLVVAYVLLYLGILAYKYYFISWSWRAVYVMTTLLNGVFSALQVLLIQGITFGLSPFLFALGDDAFADFIGGIQFLPTTIMMVHLCPTGSEGASYAMFTTVNNSALTLCSALSTLMLGIWDVSKETMVSGDLSGMTKLTILTTIVQVSALAFVKLLPRTKDDLTRLHDDARSGSKVGGFVFLAVTFLSIIYSVVIGVLNVVKPGWAGESR